ncbi:MAG: VOC family protein [Pseudomonadota bacterium]
MNTAQIPVPGPKGQRPHRFSHMLLQTPKFQEMAPWYKCLLSANAMFENEIVCFMTYDDEHHRLVLFNKPDAEPRNPNAAGVGHFAYAFDSLADLLKNYKRLRDEHDMTPAYCVNHGFMTSFYYHDPDGNEVELGVNNFPNNEAINDWFDTGAFDANFFGFMCDPAAMLDMYESGQSEADIFAETYK